MIDLSELFDFLGDVADNSDVSIPDEISLPESVDSIALDDYDSVDADGVSFRGKDTLPSGYNEDGFISDGNITLESTISDREVTFRKFNKGGSEYVLYNGNYIRLTGNTVTIGGIKYDVP